jgi:type II secretory pathway component GspD/PulD (secretin)
VPAWLHARLQVVDEPTLVTLDNEVALFKAGGSTSSSATATAVNTSTKAMQHATM